MMNHKENLVWLQLNSVPFDVAAEDKAANNPLAMIFFFILTFLLMNFQTKLNLIITHNL